MEQNPLAVVNKEDSLKATVGKPRKYWHFSKGPLETPLVKATGTTRYWGQD